MELVIIWSCIVSDQKAIKSTTAQNDLQLLSQLSEIAEEWASKEGIKC